MIIINKQINKNGNRLALLRSEKGWSQKEFARLFSEFAPRYDKHGNVKPPLQTMTISNWETGRKVPPAEVLFQLSAFYNVSFDYLCGRTNNDSVENTNSQDFYFANTPIKLAELVNYNEKPVYMRFQNPQIKDQWGIVNSNNRYVICELGKISFDDTIEYFISEPLENLTIHTNGSKYLLNINDIMKKEIIYCEPIGADSRMEHIIRGFYVHSPDRSCLTNKKNGYALPYEALGETYNAYDHR